MVGLAAREEFGVGGAEDSSEESSEGDGLDERAPLAQYSNSEGSGLGGREGEGLGGFDVRSAPSQSSPASARSSSCSMAILRRLAPSRLEGIRAGV